MDINVAYLHNKIADIHDEHEPLIITACGFYRFKNTPIFKTHRPKGRTVSLLFYLKVSGDLKPADFSGI